MKYIRRREADLMPNNSLMELFSNDSIANILNKNSETEFTSKSKAKGDFASRISKWADEVVDKYYTYGIDTNESISKIAAANSLVDEQISRIIEESNQEIYLTEYGKLKDSSNRDVQFKIASLSEIKSKMDNSPITEQSTANKMASYFSGEEFEKTASEHIADNSFLTKSSFGTTALGVEKPIQFKDILVEKIAKETDDMNREVQKEADEYSNEIWQFGEVMIKYACMGYDMQDIFENVCKTSEVRKSAQSPIIKAITKQAEYLVENKAIPTNVDYKLAMVDTLDKVASVSLGKHSLSTNSQKETNTLPKILLADKKLVSGVKDLVNMAANIQKRHDVLKQKVDKQQTLLNKLSGLKAV
jgi:hypothetical protein